MDEDGNLPSMEGGIRVDVVTIALSPSLGRVTEWGFGAVVVPIVFEVDEDNDDDDNEGTIVDELIVTGEQTILLILLS